MSFYIEIEAETQIATGAYSEAPGQRDGFISRLISDVEKDICDSRRSGDILIDDGSLRIAGGPERIGKLSIKDAVNELFSSIEDPEKMAKVWGLRTLMDHAFVKLDDGDVLRKIIENKDLSGDSDLEDIKNEILSLPQWVDYKIDK